MTSNDGTTKLERDIMLCNFQSGKEKLRHREGSQTAKDKQWHLVQTLVREPQFDSGSSIVGFPTSFYMVPASQIARIHFNKNMWPSCNCNILGRVSSGNHFWAQNSQLPCGNITKAVQVCDGNLTESFLLPALNKNPNKLSPLLKL